MSEPASRCAAATSRASPRRAQRGYTPLLAAANHGHPEVVRLLLDSGADKNILSDVRARCVGARRVRQRLAQSGCRLSGWAARTAASLGCIALAAAARPQGGKTPLEVVEDEDGDDAIKRAAKEAVRALLR